MKSNAEILIKSIEQFIRTLKKDQKFFNKRRRELAKQGDYLTAIELKAITEYQVEIIEYLEETVENAIVE